MVTKPRRPLTDPVAYEAWLKTLDSREYEKECGRTYRDTEFVLNAFDEYDDCVEVVDHFDTKAQGLAALAKYEFSDNVVRVELEKVLTVHKAIDFDVLDRTETLIASREREQPASDPA
jgi:hypothetical protein